jgi:nucleotide-binding universal stress UspA family protein
MTTLEAGKRIALKNILFATDFSACSNAAQPYALAIAHQYDAKLFGAHVVPSEDYLFTAPESWPARVLRSSFRECRTRYSSVWAMSGRSSPGLLANMTLT